MVSIASIRSHFGALICRRCINRLCRANLEPSDCYYESRFPRTCPCCGEVHMIVAKFRPSGVRKLLLRSLHEE